MEHPDFRVNGKIFASLGYPDKQWGVVKLSPEEQATFVRDQPKVFVPVKGAWGRTGNTQVHLAEVDEPTLRQAILAAWNTVASKRRSAKSKSRRRISG